MSDTENIEARLCAYVEGDLDDAGRAEIEAHLASNPQHRQLLAELQAQHALLAELPRIAAPDDLQDAVQTQLERSVLLNDAMERPVIAGRIHRLPQLVAAAAVVLLGIGLIAVIYMVLPARRQPASVAIGSGAATRPQLAHSPRSGNAGSIRGLAPAATQPGALARAGADKLAVAMADRRSGPETKAQGPLPDSSMAMKEAAPAMKQASPAMKEAAPEVNEPPSPKLGMAKAVGNGDVFAPAMPIQSKAGPGGPRTYPNLFVDQGPLDEAGAQRLRMLHGLTADAPVVIVASANPAVAGQQVRRFLADNKIHWEPASEPMPQPLNFSQRQVVLPQRMQNRIEMQLKSGEPHAQQGVAPGSPSTAIGGASPAPSTQNASAPGPSIAAKGQKVDGSNEGPIASQISPAPVQSPAATAPSGDVAARSTILGEQVQTPSVQTQSAQDQSNLAQADFGGEDEETVGAPPTTMPAPTLIIARGLTAQQVTALNDNLASLNAARVTDFMSNRQAVLATPSPPMEQPNAAASAQQNFGSPTAVAPATAGAGKPSPAPPIMAPASTAPAQMSQTMKFMPATAPTATTQAASASTQPGGATANAPNGAGRTDVIILVRRAPNTPPPIFLQRVLPPPATAPAVHPPATAP